MARDFIKPRPKYEHRMNKNPFIQLLSDICQKAALPLVKEMGKICQEELKEEGFDFENMFNPQGKK